MGGAVEEAKEREYAYMYTVSEQRLRVWSPSGSNRRRMRAGVRVRSCVDVDVYFAVERAHRYKVSSIEENRHFKHGLIWFQPAPPRCVASRQ